MAKPVCRPVVRSSFIEEVCYEPDARVLELQLRGRKFEFADVDKRTVDGLLRAKSMGKYFNERIKD